MAKIKENTTLDYVSLFKGNLKPSTLNERVVVKCYNDAEEMTRKDALNFYYDCMKNSEGAEHERYESIFCQLLEGKTTCSDRLAIWAF